ncbi:MAG: winged helix-turn-helix transcriptional regulator [Desulfobacterales bacterium]|nr:winged helix-turn-helix transcriptional regulator [Desulfobacterales bacterium]
MTGSKEGKALQDDPNGTPRNTAAEKTGRPVSRQFDFDDLQCIAFLAKSLSDANRLRILLLISVGRKSVSAIVEALDLSQPLVSHHLKELRRSLLVRVEREGPFIYYELADPGILNILEALSDMAADLLSARKTF